MPEQRANPLALRDSCRAFLRGVLRPFLDLAQAYLVLRGIPVNGDREFRHRTGV